MKITLAVAALVFAMSSTWIWAEALGVLLFLLIARPWDAAEMEKWK